MDFKNATKEGLLELARKGYADGSEEVRSALETIFGRENLHYDITDRVKSYEDACRVLGIESVLNSPITCMSVKDGCLDSLKALKMPRNIVALCKLQVITKALNEGWENPQYDDGNWVYWPWFRLLKDEKMARDYEQRGYKVVTVTGKKNVYGLAYSYSDDAPSHASTHFGSRLCFKTPELAYYAATTFTELYADYLLIGEDE